MGLYAPAKMAALAAIVLLLITAVPGTAALAGEGMTSSRIYTTVRLNDLGGGHVEQHIIIADISNIPIAAGAFTLDLQKNDAPWAGLISPRNNYHNVSVNRQDGTPAECVLKESGGSVQLQIFSPDLLMTNWNTQFIVSYDVDRMISNNLLTSEFGFSGALSGPPMDECELTVLLPAGSHVTCASPGAAIAGSSVSWTGPDAYDVAIEYSRLPLPSLQVPLQYLFWGGLMLLALVWCFKPRRLIRWRNEADEMAYNSDLPVNTTRDVPDRGDGCDRE
jgi:hypothetical protein